VVLQKNESWMLIDVFNMIKILISKLGLKKSMLKRYLMQGDAI